MKNFNIRINHQEKDFELHLSNQNGAGVVLSVVSYYLSSNAVNFVSTFIQTALDSFSKFGKSCFRSDCEAGDNPYGFYIFIDFIDFND